MVHEQNGTLQLPKERYRIRDIEPRNKTRSATSNISLIWAQILGSVEFCTVHMYHELPAPLHPDPEGGLIWWPFRQGLHPAVLPPCSSFPFPATCPWPVERHWMSRLSLLLLHCGHSRFLGMLKYLFSCQPHVTVAAFLGHSFKVATC